MATCLTRELYDEYALFCSALKQMKDEKAAVNAFDLWWLEEAAGAVFELEQYVAVQNEAAGTFHGHPRPKSEGIPLDGRAQPAAH